MTGELLECGNADINYGELWNTAVEVQQPASNLKSFR